jgi:uncharacterized protein (DUF488 family)
MSTPNIFTVGYRGLTPSELVGLVRQLRAVLIDVRSVASGRVKRGFAKADLKKLLGGRYEHRPELGGRGSGPTEETLDRLAAEKRRVVLMCACDRPGDCHRHGLIALPLASRGVEVLHVWRDEVIEARELQRAIDDETEYECEDLAEFTRRR